MALLKLFVALSSLPAAWAATASQRATCEVIKKDVVIVGGGAAGSHAAVRLRQDYNKTVVVVEKESNLGGHVDTYYDPVLKVYRDFGVQIYFPYMDAMDFIARFDNMTLVEGLAPRGSTVTRYIDFSSGRELLNYTAPAMSSEIPATVNFYNALINNGYDKMIEPGFWNLPPGPKIPADLLMPIGQFAAKYNATLALSLLWSSVGGGAGSLGVFKDVMTLTVLQSFSASYIKVYMGLIPYYHIQGGNQRLFDAIAALLRDDVLLNTVVTSAKRDDTGVSLVVSGPNGTRKIEAKKLLFAIPPTRENLAPFDLNADETLHFSKPKYGRYHTGVVSHSALTKGVVFQNTPAIAVQDSSAPFLNAPFVLDFNSYGNDTNLFSIGTSGSNYTEYTPEAAAALAQKNIETMAKAGTLPNLNGEKLKVVDWSDHGPGGYSVSPAQMQAGWMSDMYGLQGKRSTWFTGNAIAIDFSTMLWKFNDDLIPRILKSW